MQKNDNVKRCKQCGKILITESKIGRCQRCVDKDKQGVFAIGSGSIVVGLIIKAGWKTIKGLINVIKRK